MLCLTLLIFLVYLSHAQTYEYAPGKYQSFKFTGKPDTIKITNKIVEGENTIGKTNTGNTITATVKNGTIVKITMINAAGKKVNLNSPPRKAFGSSTGIAKTILICMHCWVSQREGRPYYVCNDVPCRSSDANAVRQVTK